MQSEVETDRAGAGGLTVGLEVVTPLFLGGADAATPELRTASFRGALRFWWRALAAEPDLQALRHRETAVFGGPQRASSVRLATEASYALPPSPWRDLAPLPPRAPRGHDGQYHEQDRQHGLSYVSFPLRNSPQGTSPRRGLAPGTRLRLALSPRRAQSPDDAGAVRQAYAALWLLLQLGGLGTRARRGLGSIAAAPGPDVPLDGLPPLRFPGGSVADLAQFLEDGLQRLRHAVPTGVLVPNQFAPYSLLSPHHARTMVVGRTWPSWQAALGEVGFRLATFRVDQQIYPRMADVAREEVPDRVADRAAFGLPIPYFRRNPPQKYTLVPGAGSGNNAPDRRASPLLLHVAALGPERYTVVLTFFLGARLLPQGVPVHANGRVFRAPTDLAKVIGPFLNSLKANPGLHLVRLP